MADYEQKDNPATWHEVLSRAFDPASQGLMMLESRPSRRGMNFRKEIDVNASDDVLEIRTLTDQVAVQTNTFPASGDASFSVDGEPYRISQYFSGDTVEVVDKGSSDQQSHFFGVISSRDGKNVVVSISGTNDYTTMSIPIMYKAFRRSTFALCCDVGSSRAVDRTQVISDNS